jgi:hypothetical protein
MGKSEVQKRLDKVRSIREGSSNIQKRLSAINKSKQEKSKNKVPVYRRGIDIHITDIPIKAIYIKDRILETGTGTRISILNNHPILKGITTPLKVGVIYNMKYRNWHHDPNPQILVFYSDIGKNGRFTEGLNLRYLPADYITRLFRFICMHPEVDSYALYEIVKSTYNKAIKEGYRRYLQKHQRPTLSIYKS